MPVEVPELKPVFLFMYNKHEQAELAAMVMMGLMFIIVAIIIAYPTLSKHL